MLAAFTSKPIDLSKGDMFFYADHLSPLWYITVIIVMVCTLSSSSKFLRFFSLTLLVGLFYGFPAMLLINPRINDQYPFMAEPLYVLLHGHLGNVHETYRSPGLALFFSQLLLTMGLKLSTIENIHFLSDFFALMNPIVITLILMVLSSRLNSNPTVSILLFLSFSYVYTMDFFHRQTFSIPLFFLLIYSIVKKNNLMVIVSSIALVFMHPGTPLFTWIAMAVSFTFLFPLKRLFRKNRFENNVITVFFYAMITLIVSWFGFHSATTYSILPPVVGAFEGFIRDVIEGSELLAVEKVAVGTTAEFRQLILIPRIMLMGTYLIIFWLVVLVNFLLILKRKLPVPVTLTIFTLFHIGFIPQVVPFIYWGIFNIRALLFVIYSSIFISPLHFSLAKQLISEKKVFSQNILRFFRQFIIATSIVSIILGPLLTYATVPFLHSSTAEIYAQQFVELKYDRENSMEPVAVTEYPVWIFYVLAEGDTVLTGIPENSTQVISDVNTGRYEVLVVGRHVTREPFYAPTGILFGSGKVETQSEFISKVVAYGDDHWNRVLDFSYNNQNLSSIVVVYVRG